MIFREKLYLSRYNLFSLTYKDHMPMIYSNCSLCRENKYQFSQPDIIRQHTALMASRAKESLFTFMAAAGEQPQAGQPTFIIFFRYFFLIQISTFLPCSDKTIKRWQSCGSKDTRGAERVCDLTALRDQVLQIKKIALHEFWGPSYAMHSQ